MMGKIKVKGNTFFVNRSLHKDLDTYRYSFIKPGFRKVDVIKARTQAKAVKRFRNKYK